MDVKSKFLHEDLHEEIYMQQPTGFIEIDSILICRHNKSLYGLKQTPQASYAKMDSLLLETDFSRCHSDNTIHTKKVGNSLIILFVYVDDLILTSSDPNLINHVKSKPENAEEYPLLVGFNDSNWVGDPNDRNRTAGYTFTLGSGPITWAYKKKSVFFLSSVEAKYHDIIEASKEAMWLHQIMSEYGFQQQHTTTLWCDNKSAIQLCKDPVQHQCSKHVELHMHFIIKLIHDNFLEV
eukprot:PITA_11352